jgi:hypothetical protein
MPSYEENMQNVLDLRARVLDPEQVDPTAEEVWEGVNALHLTRGVAAKKSGKSSAVKPIVDLASLFAPAAEVKS